MRAAAVLVVLLAGLLAACGGDAEKAAPSTAVPTSASSAPRSSPGSPSGTSSGTSPRTRPAVDGDVDGDGKPDRVTVDASAPWTVRVALSGGGVATAQPAFPGPDPQLPAPRVGG